MNPRVPTSNDFPSHLVLTITPPPSSQPPASILILLHGLGDTHSPFARLAQQMSLPSTLCISLRAPTPLPFDVSPSPGGGYHWGDDLVFDPSKPDGGVDVEACGYEKAVGVVAEEVIQGVLVRKCGWNLRDTVIMGMGQGGVVALGVADALGTELQGELGGVISLGGTAGEEMRRRSKAVVEAKKRKSRTPILVCHGSSRSAVTVDRAREIKEAFEFVEFAQWKRQGDGMAKSRDEMMPIMRFFGRRLRSRAGVPEGAVEIG